MCVCVCVCVLYSICKHIAENILKQTWALFATHFIDLDWFVWFYGISTFVSYLTPNPFLRK